MATIYCDYDAELMELTEEDARQEWTEQVFVCATCGASKVRHITYDQNGVTLADDVEGEDGNV